MYFHKQSYDNIHSSAGRLWFVIQYIKVVVIENSENIFILFNRNHEMASISSIISKSEYWCRLAIKCDHHIGKALLNILHNSYNDSTYQGLPDEPSKLYTELKKHEKILKDLRKRKVIFDEQWELLFPADKKTNSSKFDVTVTVVLIRNCTTLPSPSGGWKYPLPSDKSIGANCIRARDDVRNFLYHYPCISNMKEPEFIGKWNESDNILIGLQYTISTLELKTKSLDPDRVSYLQLVLNYLKVGQNALQDLVDQNTTDIQNVKVLTSDVSEMKKSIDEMSVILTNKEKLAYYTIANLETKLEKAFSKYEDLHDRHGKEIKDIRSMINAHDSKIEKIQSGK